MASKLMSMSEIKSAYDRLSRDNNMMALSAVLRIGAEQIERRGKIGIFKNIVIATGGIALCFSIAAFFAPDNIKPSLQIWQIVAICLMAISLGLLWRVRNNMEQFLKDEQDIRVLMVETAQRIVGVPTFNPTPLSEELRGTLRNAVAHVRVKASDELTAIIDRH
ncbi:MAG: hypothetical protein JST12_09320 [Armatimonadetes bacterium]|nr:hypothetical protein [Armatimonadota bacterium]MBS1701847.1 hypothetical protein [Armatimonadota bacterium]MBS1728316.1 hypothetical protein [Armatimonadota bacterium]